MPKHKQKINKVRQTTRCPIRNKDGDQEMLNLGQVPVNPRFFTIGSF